MKQETSIMTLGYSRAAMQKTIILYNTNILNNNNYKPSFQSGKH